jgi:glutaredoxin 3
MNHIVIYTKNICPYCERAKTLLNSKKAIFDEINIEHNELLRDKMIAMAGGRKTVPQIFIGKAHIGGCDDLYELESRGELDKLLDDVRVEK